MHESFLSYRKRRYLWVAVALTILCVFVYAFDDPRESPSGDTWLGYTLGGLGAAIIVALTMLGIRKRSYRSTLGTLQGWVSAHVYLGLALIVVVTLHTGFQFGWNIHTAAYVLMMLVILSGIVGIVVYRRMPTELSSNRSGLTREEMIAELAELDQRAVRIAAALPAAFADAARSNRDRTRIGGGVWAVLSGADRSRVELPAGPSTGGLVLNPDQSRLLEWLGAELARSTDGEKTRAIDNLLSIVGARRVLLARLRRDARIRGWLEIWLYIHVPATFALLGALVAHVLSVFYYW